MATAFKQVKNNAKSIAVAGELNNTASILSFSVAPGQGAKFPVPGNGFYVTAWNVNRYPDPSDDPSMRIGLCTARDGDMLTVTWGQLGTPIVALRGRPAVRLHIVDQYLLDAYNAIATIESGILQLTGQKTIDGSGSTNIPFRIKGSQTNNDLLSLLNNAGIQKWIASLRNGTDIDITESGVANGRFYLKAGGLAGFGTTNPTAGLDLPASLAAAASLRIRAGVGPISPNSGDVWQDGAHLYARINSRSRQIDPVIFNVKDYGAKCDGVTNDTVAVQATADAMVNGGRLYIPGRCVLTSSITCKYSGSTVEGDGEDATVIINGVTTFDSGLGLFTFWNPNGTSPVHHGTVRRLSIDLNGSTPGIAPMSGIHFRGTTTADVITRGHLVEDVKIYNKGADGSGASGAIRLTSSYGDVVGQLEDIIFNRVVVRDSNVTSEANPNAFSVLILANKLDTLTINDCAFRETYGHTIIHNSNGSVLRGFKNYGIYKTKFIHTMKNGYWGQGTADINNVYRTGYDGFQVRDCTFDWDGDKSAGIRQYYHITFYDAIGVDISHNIFKNSMSIFAPGTSDGADPVNGNEDKVFKFSNNLVYEAYQLGDMDGFYASDVSDNLFYKIRTGGVLGGYGRHGRTTYNKNIFYNCVYDGSDPQIPYDVLFDLQDGGNIIENNFVYNDVGMNAMTEIFREISVDAYSGYRDLPNVYKNNIILGAPVSNKTFGLDSEYKHVIQDNYGVVESTIKNSYTHFAAVVSSLAASDIVEDNYTLDGVKVQEYFAQGNVSGTPTINRSDGRVIAVTLTGNIAPVFSPGKYPGDRMTVKYKQDATGGRSSTWPANFKKAGGSLGLSSAANAEDVVDMYWDKPGAPAGNWYEASRALNLS